MGAAPMQIAAEKGHLELSLGEGDDGDDGDDGDGGDMRRISRNLSRFVYLLLYVV